MKTNTSIQTSSYQEQNYYNYKPCYYTVPLMLTSQKYSPPPKSTSTYTHLAGILAAHADVSSAKHALADEPVAVELAALVVGNEGNGDLAQIIAQLAAALVHNAPASDRGHAAGAVAFGGRRQVYRTHVTAVLQRRLQLLDIKTHVPYCLLLERGALHERKRERERTDSRSA